MGRRERYIPLTDAELCRLEEEHVAKQKLVENRKALIAKTLRSQRKDSLVQVLIKLCDENIHARWLVVSQLGGASDHRHFRASVAILRKHFSQVEFN